MALAGFSVLCMVMTVVFVSETVLSQDNSEAYDEPLSNTYYTGAVFEHARQGNSTTDQPLEFVQKNLLFYENAAKEAKLQSVDIIVFPEYGLFPWLPRVPIKSYLEHIPDPKKLRSNPCNHPEEYSDRPILYGLSCIAKQNNMVVVANMGDIQPCDKEHNPNCPDDGTFHFNANVAFDKNGTILAKYHKEHLFLEPGMNFPQEPQNPIFKTDFGTFAMYICFDVNYKNITIAARRNDVDAVLLPNMWFDFKPFMSSVQFFDAWSSGNDVPFLAANGQLNYDSVVGSGIFSGRGFPLIYTYNPDGLSKLLVSRVSRRNSTVLFLDYLSPTVTVITQHGPEPYDILKDGNDFPEVCTRKTSGTNDLPKTYHCAEEDTEEYSFVKLTKTTDTLDLCNNGLCCELTYAANTMDEDFYFGVFNGSTEVDGYAWCTQSCFVARCDSFNNSVCRTFPMTSNTVFQRVGLESNTMNAHSIYPSMIKNKGRLSSSQEKSFVITANQGDSFTVHLNYESPSEEPMTFFGVYGRCFDQDPPFPSV